MGRRAYVPSFPAPRQRGINTSSSWKQRRASLSQRACAFQKSERIRSDVLEQNGSMEKAWKNFEKRAGLALMLFCASLLYSNHSKGIHMPVEREEDLRKVTYLASCLFSVRASHLRSKNGVGLHVRARKNSTKDFIAQLCASCATLRLSYEISIPGCV